MKRFRESGEILVCKGQGQKPLHNVHDHWALRRYCLRNHRATTMDIATWAREYFGKSLLLNTVHRCTMKCNLKLYYGKRKAFILRRNAAEFSGPKVIWDGPKDNGNVFSGRTSQLVFVKNGRWILCDKDEKDHPDCYQRKVQNQPLWWYGGASVPTTWVICIYVKVPLMWRLMFTFWRDICCQDNDFSQELHVYFSRTLLGLILHELQHRVHVLDWTACRSPIENVWCIMKRTIRQHRPRSVE